jgi:hypothetical protein
MSVKVTVSQTTSLQAMAEAAARQATEFVMEELAAAFQASFDANAWNWPRSLPTRKLNGDTLKKRAASYRKGEGITPPNPRNIVDSGNLRETDSWWMSGPYQATFKWSSEYATFIHEGGSMKPWGNDNAQRVIIPARPWTRAVLGQENVSGIRVYNVGQRLRDVWLAKLRSP